ncbi:MAG: UDP-N-acetylmuramoyl-L-alanyl-D-glutamate--2,6-diaminopimelate ligase [Endomicrobium sp.]|jgi:UDP-N-acetylmuramoyl-L-alanyl-D-glutamate--2,6-diaminopimelate ligase|nr:UDP-N-acetylmuramoyl-L-alanyl-D-glutamate--2,6-diaminopimelate ligase [Endomicrobium sp.]
MKIKDFAFFKDAEIFGDMETEISGVEYDSRNVSKGDAFFALPGHNTDGNKFIEEAVLRGASVVIVKEKIENLSTAQIAVKDIFKFMSVFCAKFYNYPDRELTVIGVTGTNGKTTITYMIESVFAYNGLKCGVVGTVNYRYGGKIYAAPNTTPQSADIYKMARQMADLGIKYLVMEVSSHALSLGRVFGIDFDIAVFTNLTQDHLDFHKDMRNYFEAKALLFKNLGKGGKQNKKYAIINADDKYGIKLSQLGIDADIKFYSLEQTLDEGFSAKNIIASGGGNKFDAIYGGQTQKADIKHIGLHNVYNALAALGACVSAGVSFEKAVGGLNNAAQAPGRLERIDAKRLGFEIVVDYAHTEDALKNAVSALRRLHPKRIITVFGCGGDRDRTKRPYMGKIAVETSDFVFATSDNPRTEDPIQILLDVEVGIKRTGKTNYKIEADREAAIKEAVMMADKGDIILIAGKGHENYQIIGTQKFHFNDVEIAEKYAALRENLRIAANRSPQKEFDF